MTDTKAKITKWEWWRDHFAAWFAGSFVMASLFLCIIVSIGVGMFFDGEYAKRWSPNPEWDFVFQLFGWSISWFMILGSAAGVKAISDEAKVAGAILLTVSVFFTLLSVTQSIGIVALTAQDMAAKADTYERVTQQVQTTNTNRIDELNRQRAALEKERDNAIANIERTLANTEDDGIAGIGSSDLEFIALQRQKVIDLRAEYRERIQAISDKILNEYQVDTLPIQNAPQERPPSRFDPVIDVLGWILTLGNPTDAFKEGLTIVYVTFWSLGCPLMGQMLSVFLVITRHASKKKCRSDLTQSEYIEIDGETLTEDEIIGAIEARRKRQQAGQKGAQTKKVNRELQHIAKVLRKKVNDEVVLMNHERMNLVRTLKKNGLIREEIAKAAGYANLNEFDNWVRLIFDSEEARGILTASVSYHAGEQNGATE